MRKDKENAIKMRKSGKSYRQIHQELKIPVSTLSDWFSKLDWSKEMAQKLAKEAQKEHTARLVELDKIRGRNLDRVYEEARREAAEELKILKYNPLFIAGLMLYWGEGDKTSDHQVRFTNTDPDMVRLYVFFLTHGLRIPKRKIGVHLLLYPDLDDWLCRVYWMQATGLSKEHFMKSTVIQGKHKTRRLSFGICMVHVSSSYVKTKVREWLKLFHKELMDKAYYENMGQ